MSNDNPTPEAEPLHTATLLAVLAKLRDRLAAIPALVDDDTADHPLTHVELAGWEARVESLEAFAADVALMLKDANPRARVIVLPKPLVNSWGTRECGVDYYGESDEEDSEIVVTIDTGTLFVQVRQGVEEARDLALNLLAAVDKEAEQLAGGAQ